MHYYEQKLVFPAKHPTNVPEQFTPPSDSEQVGGGRKYSKIYNPISKEYTSLHSPLGRNVLIQYIKELTK